MGGASSLLLRYRESTERTPPLTVLRKRGHEGRDSKALGEDFDAHFGTYTGINGKFVLDGKRVRLAPERGESSLYQSRERTPLYSSPARVTVTARESVFSESYYRIKFKSRLE